MCYAVLRCAVSHTVLRACCLNSAARLRALAAVALSRLEVIVRVCTIRALVLEGGGNWQVRHSYTLLWWITRGGIISDFDWHERFGSGVNALLVH